MSLIKTKEQIEGIRTACLYVRDGLNHAASHLRDCNTTKDIELIIQAYLEERAEEDNIKIESASLGYKGFPGYCCISVNSELCHGIPTNEKQLFSGDLVKIDLALKVNGYYGDSCRTYYLLGEQKQEVITLEYVTRTACKLACKSVKPGKRVGDIGFLIQTIVRSCGFNVVNQFIGHGIGLDCLHDAPAIYHFGERNKGEMLHENMVITIEPIVVVGKPDFYIEKDGWTVKTKDGRLAAQHEETVLITSNGYEILT